MCGKVNESPDVAHDRISEALAYEHWDCIGMGKSGRAMYRSHTSVGIASSCSFHAGFCVVGRYFGRSVTKLRCTSVTELRYTPRHRFVAQCRAYSVCGLGITFSMCLTNQSAW